jgi:uncharacterized protein YdhG (YjbR/CyaY superfamily)
MRKATAAKPYATQTPPSQAVEAYILGVPEPVRTTLRQLREIIRKAVPAGASEVISYGIPAFSFPKPFFGYAAFKSHLSVLPFSGCLLDSFAEELRPYARTKSSLHLPFDRPLPATLIRRLFELVSQPFPSRRPSKYRLLPNCRLPVINRLAPLPRWARLDSRLVPGVADMPLS